MTAEAGAQGPPTSQTDLDFADAPLPLTFQTWPDRRIENLSSLIDALAGRVGDSARAVEVREILALVGRRAYGPLLLVIGLLAVSPVSLIPGSTWAFALATLLIAGQLACGLRRPWVPQRVLSVAVPAGVMRHSLSVLRPWARRVDAFLQPRLTFLATPPLVNLFALSGVVAALITFPLGFIPFAPFVPSAAIILFGLGMTARDGLVLCLSALTVACAGALALSILA